MSSSFSEFVDNCASVEEVKQRIHLRMKNVFEVTGDGELQPYVCSVCDEFILSQCDVEYVGLKLMKKLSPLLSWSQNFRDEERIPALEVYYRFPQVAPTFLSSERSWIDKMALSPRGHFERSRTSNRYGFVTCWNCKEHLSCKKPKMPFYAVANHHHVGAPPEELVELTDIERTFLTPVRSHGYFFTYEGGSMKQMKGSMTFMRVEERKVAKAVTTLETMGLTKHVVIMISGNMTEAQHKKAKKLSEFRTDKMIAAVKWLCANHRHWKNVNLNDIVDEIGRTKPIRIEKVSTVKSGNATVEEEVVFTCYYPDGATNTNTGGFSQAEEFKLFVEEMKAKNFDVQLKANIEKNFVQSSDGDLLISASLLQFPYGVGSMEETRLLPDGKTTSKSELSEFLSHLSRKADPLFQSSLFQLIMYSVKNKTRLLRSSGLQLKYKFDATVLAEGFSARDFSKACAGRRQKKNPRRGTQLSNKVLDAVDATARDLPHTDQAAKQARSSMESMFHHLGLGSVFLTVTFDDENSILIQVLSGVRVDKGERVEDLSDEELASRAQKRTNIRYDFPGVAALNFEILLNILLDEVICWDVDNNCPIDGKESLFGKLKAVAFAVEEQGRKTLHVHFILWVEEYNLLQTAMFFGNEADKRDAKYIAQRFYDHLASTTVFPTDGKVLRVAFEHDGCSVPSKDRRLPEVLCDQELRYLRHKNGYDKLEGEFAHCPHCPKKWTYEELLDDYIQKGEGITDKVTLPDITNGSTGPDSKSKQRQLRKDRMLAKIVEFQHPSKDVTEEPTVCINACYQSHASCHHKNCFKCTKFTGKKKKSHVCGKTCECRYRLPDKKRLHSQVQTQHEGTTWYEWTGEKKLQPLVMFLPKRNTYDLFQNVACPAISNSKFTCNSNVAVITDGPIGMYSCKYINKPNEKDDTTEYAQVEAVMKKMDDEGRKHDNDKSEALRIICRAAFAHNRTNVVSASLASYLTRHDSRFYFSLQFKYCPLRDLIRIHNRQEIGGSVTISKDGSSYLENQALHYLCRPEALDDLNLKEFTEKWEVTYVTAKNKDDVLPFEIDTGFYRHPSAQEKGRGKKKTTECRQGVRLRETILYAKFTQWGFPDAEGFRANILTCADTDINRAMESFAQMALTLLVPHRAGVELMCNNVYDYPYVHKLRELYDSDMVLKANGSQPKIFTKETLTLLQNVQNAAYNCTRYKGSYDELAATTVPLSSDDVDGIAADDDSDDEEDDNNPNTGYEEFLECIDDQFNRSLHDEDPAMFHAAMNNFSFKHIRDHGDDRCGFKTDFELPDLIRRGEQDPFVKTTTAPANQANRERQQRRRKEDRKTYSVKEITAVLLKRTTKSHRNVWKGKTIDVEKATGSIRSIREWSLAAFGSDKKQQRAFEAIIAAFLLTFYDDDGNPASNSNSEMGVTLQEKLRFRRTRTALLKLKGDSEKAQMICLLHGPGGSGKSTVINMVTAYAKSFCEMLNHPFDNRTITLTALTGIAATLLHGETVHWALGLNKKTLPQKMREQFNDARLVIIDEISFASAELVAKMHECLKILMGKSYRRFGGVNVVFAGDFSQLDPVRCKQKLYEANDIPEWNHSLNCFIELDGTHRFKDDPFWGKVLLRFRAGKPTHKDIDLINNTCHVSVKEPPQNIQVATAYNRNRDAINAGIFEDWCAENKPADGSILREACVIFMDDLEMSTSVGAFVPVQSNQVRKFFYANCGENDIELAGDSKGRVDPMLKLYPGCPVMLTMNNDVSNGQANGCRLTMQRITCKPGEQPFPLKLDCGTTINALFASQIETFTLEHVNDDIEPRHFNLEPENWTFSTKLEVGDVKMKVSMRGHQFPIISNSCTTGHKLQGCSLDNVLVNDWMYQHNWAYVVLSRVRTLAGLYIRRDLSHDLKKYEKSEKMLAMLKDFRKRLSLSMFTDQEYETMILDTEP